MTTTPPETEKPPELSYEELCQVVHDFYWLIADLAVNRVLLHKLIKNDPRWLSVKRIYPAAARYLTDRPVRICP